MAKRGEICRDSIDRFLVELAGHSIGKFDRFSEIVTNVMPEIVKTDLCVVKRRNNSNTKKFRTCHQTSQCLDVIFHEIKITIRSLERS